MARIDIKSNGATLNDGVLQLENGVAMDSTLRNVADQNNTTSPLKLSTTAVQVVSPLRITTDDPSDMYLDCEDGSANNRFNITRNTASQQVNLNFASNPAGSTTIVGAIRTFTDGVNLGEVVTFREDGQVTFSERVNVEADSLVTTESCSVIAASTSNANLVIAPNGTGALIADIPDGTIAGGNARGNNSVDLQMSRTNVNQVAVANNSFIGGGANNSVNIAYGANEGGVVVGGVGNTVGANYGFIGGGSGNSLSGNDNYQVIVGGSSNGIASSGGSFIGGGNANSINTFQGTGYCVISGGRSNSITSTYSTVSGGQSNTASTNTHATVVGGQSNTASGQYSVAGGFSNTASGRSSVCLGETNTANSSYGVALGNQSKSYLQSQQSLASGFFTANSDAQQSSLTARRSAVLTTGGTTVLSLDGTGVTNLIIPEGTNRMWNVQVRWVAVVAAITGTATGVTVGDTKTSTDLFAVAKRAGTTTVSAHTSAGTHAIETIAGSLTAANIAYTAGASQEMAITFTGPTFAGGGSVTMRVVAAISLTEVAY
jgi:hypothetical protein